ncbi:MAG: response regulator transcription factor [Candidatus Rokuibacteriota bacterium]|nr:MAG: response regulator transcription factor [Candidatus Rokubacteria bacterium]
MMSSPILVVEDEQDLASTCARLLERERWRVVTVGTRAAALAALAGDPRPALAIVDRYLPDGDGLDVLVAGRAAGVPVIVVTAYAPGRTRGLSLEGGATAFLSKPFSTRQLLGVVRGILGEAPIALRSTS